MAARVDDASGLLRVGAGRGPRKSTKKAVPEHKPKGE